MEHPSGAANMLVPKQSEPQPLTPEGGPPKPLHAAASAVKEPEPAKPQPGEPVKAESRSAAPTPTVAAVIPEDKPSMPRPGAAAPVKGDASDSAAPGTSQRVQPDAPYAPKATAEVEKPASASSQQQTAFRGVIEPAEKPKADGGAQGVEQVKLDGRTAAVASQQPAANRTPSATASAETTAPRTTATADHVQELQASDRSHTSPNVISVRLGGNEMSEPVDVRFIHRAGQVEMAVRTDDTQVADRLRGNLSDLSQSLKDGGFQVDFRHSGDGARSDKSFSQQQQWGEERGRQQPEPRQDQQQQRRPRNRPDEEFSFDE